VPFFQPKLHLLLWHCLATYFKPCRSHSGMGPWYPGKFTTVYTPLAVVSRARKTLRVSTTAPHWCKFWCFVERGRCDCQHAKRSWGVSTDFRHRNKWYFN
jgi:hypothetical protein